jgi:hypothetical protein
MDDDIKSSDVRIARTSGSEAPADHAQRQRTAVVLTDLFLLNDIATMHMETATATQ